MTVKSSRLTRGGQEPGIWRVDCIEAREWRGSPRAEVIVGNAFSSRTIRTLRRKAVATGVINVCSFGTFYLAMLHARPVHVDHLRRGRE